ncbi:hypothetical protein V491_08106 [Pseudogymnoascus sp. VKM F-3775]|nr:hypothetical protein V491_08106 [Pseudogymnoascus sp. VKM F-3775]
MFVFPLLSLTIRKLISRRDRQRDIPPLRNSASYFGSVSTSNFPSTVENAIHEDSYNGIAHVTTLPPAKGYSSISIKASDTCRRAQPAMAGEVAFAGP